MRKTLRLEDITAIVDTRERTPLDLDPLRTRRATLTSGDYSVEGLENIVAVERKSLLDLVACCGRERARFEREIMRLLAYPVRCLVIESGWRQIEQGSWHWRSKLLPSHVIGSLIGWTAAGLPVILAGNHQRAGRLVVKLLFTAARRRFRECRNLVKD
jgi:DNA excision repair protein ERCC-4